MSIAHRINAERAVLLGWSRAILLQLAHPLVAAGVDEHSTFRGGPFAAAARLHHTVRAMLSLTFGDATQREATLDVIRGIHRRVHGTLAHTVGRYPAGTPYSAEDPALLLWVHATLLDSAVLAYDSVLTPISSLERDQYCAETAEIAVALGAPATAVPRRWGDLERYLQSVYASDTLAVGPQARALCKAVMRPPFAWTIAPITAVNELLTVGWLPPDLRAAYGFAWSDVRQRRVDAAVSWIGRARRVLPDAVALWPEARRSARRVRRTAHRARPSV
jgi:uncharacterized protein (DUF2236 family)